MRVYEFAKELGKDAGDLLEELNGNFGFDIKSHLSGISKEQILSGVLKSDKLGLLLETSTLNILAWRSKSFLLIPFPVI